MRALLAALLLALAACDAQQSPLREVTIENPVALGLSLRELPAAMLRASGLPYGLAVVKAGMLAQRAGLRVGDIIYAVNQQRLRNIEDFTRLVAAQAGGSLSLLVRRGTSDFYVPMDLSGGAADFKDKLLRT
ncbi:MAG TPA: PDZ domain-containing protein [Burkholderiales bacterium]|jgi:S1-C subfamily serine protease|nr:PDZ domain-containing protein [Burkholderiales bacterium]